MARALMVQGTCSGAGKSLLVAGLARLMSDRGIRVAPFKSQNMALNSFITREGAEIGRAQALQAEAARVVPASDMNPVLLKAAGESGCQVILGGRVHSTMTARQYYAFRDEAWHVVTSAYARLASAYDLILIEGAGSPAEINLAKEEIVNMRMARHADCPVVLVGDIDRGGVFASFYGTVALLPDDSRRIKAFVINKFRGDAGILAPGIDMIRERTGIPTIGVVPYMKHMALEEEDGLGLSNDAKRTDGQSVRIAVVRNGFIANFTDFDALRHEPGVELVFTASPMEIESADMVILPGTKNTVKDLLALRDAGIDAAVTRAAGRGTPVAGICGGYQMLGRVLRDPHGIESAHKEVPGLGLLDTETEFMSTKTTVQCEAETTLHGPMSGLHGYEIHMGETRGEIGLFTLKRLDSGRRVADGSRKGSVWGTYLHGVFDHDGFRHAMLDELRKRKGIPAPAGQLKYQEFRETAMNAWAAHLRQHLDMRFIDRLVGL